MAKAAVAVAGAYERQGRRGAAADYDVGLMLAFQKGNELAFQELVERNHGRVIGLIYRFISDASDAEDLAQEVFLKILRKAGSFRREGTFKAWMFNIARNVTLDHLRKA